MIYWSIHVARAVCTSGCFAFTADKSSSQVSKAEIDQLLKVRDAGLSEA